MQLQPVIFRTLPQAEGLPQTGVQETRSQVAIGGIRVKKKPVA